MAEALGQPFMPWQQLVADVGCEYDRKTGVPFYREVVVTVPRQSGKTTLFLTWQINRCLAPRWRHPQRSAFTAQSGKDARDKWLDELYPLIEKSGLYQFVRHMNRGMGNEAIKWRNGSMIRLLSTSTSSGHSKTLHQAVADEIWHDIDDRREQGLRPAMVTVEDAQLLVCSTAGTATSTVLKRKMQAGRNAVAFDSGRGIAYFEWAADDDEDPNDPATWYGCMPALCPDPPCCCDPEGRWRHTVTEDVIRTELQSMERPEFRRAYLNQWPDARTLEWLVVSRDGWDRITDPKSSAVDPVALSADIASGRTGGAIAVAGARGDGFLHGEITSRDGVLDHRTGTEWMAPRLIELAKRWDPCAVVIDPKRHAGSLIPQLEAAGVKVVKPQVRDVAQACGMFYDAVEQQQLRHRGQPPLNAALAGARTRSLGDMWLWESKGISVDISPLVALTNALWGYATRAHTVNDGDYFQTWGG